MDKTEAALAAMLAQVKAAVTLEAMRQRLDDLTGNDFPTVAALFDLLAASSKVANDSALAGQVAAIKRIFVNLWQDVEDAAL